MIADVSPVQVLLVTLSGWVNRQQQHVIEYLLEETGQAALPGCGCYWEHSRGTRIRDVRRVVGRWCVVRGRFGQPANLGGLDFQTAVAFPIRGP